MLSSHNGLKPVFNLQAFSNGPNPPGCKERGGQLAAKPQAFRCGRRTRWKGSEREGKSLFYLFVDSTAVVNARYHSARLQERAGSSTKVACNDNVPKSRTWCGGLAGAGQQRGRLSALPHRRAGRDGGQKATLFGAAGGMNGVLKTTTSESRLVFMPCH